MNTGLQDSANLAWKLASVIRDDAPDTLLGTYDAERRPVGERVVATTDRLFQAAAGGTGLVATVRDWLARPAAAAVTKSDALQHRAFRALSELDISYEGDFLEDAALSLKAGPSAGHRAPNAAVSRHQDVFDLTAGYGFTVLALAHKPLEHNEAHRVADELGKLSGKNVKTQLISRLAVGQDPRVVFVSSAEVFRAYGLTGLEQQALYVVRPDGYVAWRCDGFDFEACGRFLERFGLSSATNQAVNHAAAESVAA